MGKNLVIVESPAKAKTIGRYLGPDYEIRASVGHIRDLPSSSLGVDVNRDFKPVYINMRGKDKVIRELKDQAKNVDCVYIATDPDREGEAIAWHIAKVLKIPEDQATRISFNEITSKAVQASLEEPKRINMDLVNSQQARRILDRLVGYELSPLLWKKIKVGLSAGRVQSVATRIVVEREEEIESFVPEEYWTVDADVRKGGGQVFRLRYHGRYKSSGRAEKRRLASKAEAQAVEAAVKKYGLRVAEVRHGEKKRRPYAPFTTSTLQQEAARRLGFSSRKTMMIAQQLYEGVELPGLGRLALVTYIRTDSFRISAEAAEAARGLIVQRYGKDFLPERSRIYKNKNAAQDAHEAIRPAHFEYDPESLHGSLQADQYRLYKLIWERFLASQMADARLASVSVDCLAGEELFRASGERLLFPGFLKAYQDVKSKEEPEAEENQKLPELEKSEELELVKLLSEQKFTQPPPRYSEASLIKAMEEQGIGRPSTYAPTISTILARNYIEREGRQLRPTELGRVVTELLRENFQSIINVDFTAEMEAALDQVEEGQTNWVELLHKFYGPFHKLVEEAQERIQKVSMPVVSTGEACPECGGELVIKDGRYGKFIACNNFPKCTYTKPLENRTGRHCPRCGAEILQRKSRRGKLFYVCSHEGEDPNCDFISWDLPVDGEACPICGSYMVERKYRNKRYLSCANVDCPSRRKRSAKTGQAAESAEESERDQIASTEVAKDKKLDRSSKGGKRSRSTKASGTVQDQE